MAQTMGEEDSSHWEMELCSVSPSSLLCDKLLNLRRKHATENPILRILVRIYCNWEKGNKGENKSKSNSTTGGEVGYVLDPNVDVEEEQQCL